MNNNRNIRSLDFKELEERFFEPAFTLKDFPSITYRTINYWDESGYLLRKRRKTEKGWRRFSLIEFLWIMLLDELRILNVNIDSTISTLFDSVGLKERVGKKSIQDAQAKFLLAIMPCVIDKSGINLFICDNEANYVQDKKVFDSKYKHKNFISISINKLIVDYILAQKGDGLMNTPLLTENESELIKLIKQGDILKLTVSIENDKISVDCSNGEEGNALTQLLELIYSPYKEIFYKTKGGKTVIIEKE